MQLLDEPLIDLPRIDVVAAALVGNQTSELPPSIGRELYWEAVHVNHDLKPISISLATSLRVDHCQSVRAD